MPKLNAGILVTLALALVSATWTGAIYIGELRQEVRDLKERITIGVSHTQSWIEELRVKLRERR
jgi:hypothetical protein